MSGRFLAAVALGLALAVVGSLAVAGSSYTPPAASGGVEGDGTGVTDASAFRSALGLGTAATLTAGTSANNAVQLDGTGKLPAVDGSALTGVSASPYAADSWDLLNWTAGAGTMVADGWTSSTHASSSLTDESATEGGIACRKLTPGAAQYAGVYYTAIPSTGKWEVRLRIKVTTSGSGTSSPWYGWSVSGPSSGGLVRRLGIGLAPTDTSTSGIWYWAGASLGNTTAMISTLADQWIDWTVRVHDGRADGTGANAYYELWAGQIKLMSGYTQTTGGAVAVPWIAQSGVARSVYVGKINGTLGTSPIYVASVKVRTGWNEAPPDYTFRSLNGDVGP